MKLQLLVLIDEKCKYQQVQKLDPIFEIRDLRGNYGISMKSYHKDLSNKILLLNDSGTFTKSQVCRRQTLTYTSAYITLFKNIQG